LNNVHAKSKEKSDDKNGNAAKCGNDNGINRTG
jgi:hypothetical protein